MPFPGCKNVAGKFRQKSQAIAGTKFTKPGNGLIAKPCRTPMHLFKRSKDWMEKNMNCFRYKLKPLQNVRFVLNLTLYT